MNRDHGFHLHMGESAEGRLRIEDRSCGTCPNCSAGWPTWCVTPGSVRRSCAFQVPARDGKLVCDILAMTAAALAAGIKKRVVVVQDDRGGATSAAIALLGARVVLRAGSPASLPANRDGVSPDDDVRRALHDLTPTGKADVVVAGSGDLRRALRSVVRGGCVATAGPASSVVTVTEWVQRELRLVGPADIFAAVTGTSGPSVVGAIESAVESAA